MHESSILRMEYFIKHYCTPYDMKGRKKKVLDIGSFDVNGTYKGLFLASGFEYTGLDVTDGPNVDIVPNDMYCWESLENESFDYIVSGQAFEHIEYPWLTIREMKKKLKKDGILCIIAPNGLSEHRYPVDCWRFYSDGMKALAKWCGLEVIEVSVGGVPDLYATKKFDEIWNDVCLVACKSGDIKNRYKNSVMFPVERRYDRYSNLWISNEFLGKWKCNGEIIDKLIIEYIIRNQYNYIYIIGQGYLAEALYNLLNKHHINSACITEDNLISDKKKIEDKYRLYIITTLDMHRVIENRIKKELECISIQYLDHLVQEQVRHQKILECKNKFNRCKDIYIYGTGFNGKQIEKILETEKFSFSGFVVSDDRIKDESLKKKIYKISEISNESGIIVSPYKNEEIYRILKERKFKYIVDGLPFIEADLYLPDKGGL